MPPNHDTIGAPSGAPKSPSNDRAHLGVEARANGFYRASTCAYGPIYAPPGSQPPPVERACANSSARAVRASPVLRPGLTGTRRRLRRRGPFGPELIIVQLRSAFEKGLAPRSPLRA